MKYVFTALWALVCVVVLFFGHLHWNEKTTVHAGVQEKTILPAVKGDTIDLSQLIAKTKNWPQTAQVQFQQAVKAKKHFKILFVGSTALDGWVKDAKQQVEEAYGKDIIQITTHTYDVTTTEFVKKKDALEITAEKAPLVLFEPLLLNDNGNVEIDQSLANITKIIEDVKATNPDTTFILQPSYPLYDAKYYPLQVNALKDYAKKNNLVYLDHWQAWPNTNDVKLKDYLLPKNSGVNEKGNQLWGQFIVDYLVAK